MSVTLSKKELIDERKALLAEREKWEKEKQDYQKRIEQLESQIAQLQRKIYGRKKESVDAGQLEMALFEAQEQLAMMRGTQEAEELREQEQQEKVARKKAARSKPRFSYPEEMEQERTVIVPEEVQADPQSYRRIGQEISKYLEMVPAKLIVHVIERPRFVKITDRQQPPICAGLPPRVLAGGQAGPGLLAQVIVSKYVDHLPLYRQERIFRTRYSIDVSRKTMSDWIEHVSEHWLSLLYESIKSDVRRSELIHADETPIACQDSSKKGRNCKGYLWTYRSGEGDLLYQWHMSRSLGAAREMLGGYQGLVQCDGYKVYESLSQKEGFLTVGCMAHVRRKFYEAFEDAREQTAGWYLMQIRKLYENERESPSSGQEIASWRQQKQLPLMQEFKERMEGDRSLVPEQTAKAIAYTLGLWPSLMRYIEYPMARLDNNAVEQAIRPCKLGAKNWLFIGHPEAGRRSAILYTILGNCQVHGLNPMEYLVDILHRLPKTSSNPESIRSLLPRNWSKSPESARC